MRAMVAGLGGLRDCDDLRRSGPRAERGVHRSRPGGIRQRVVPLDGNSTLQLIRRRRCVAGLWRLWSVAFMGSTPIGGPVIGIITAAAGARVGLGVGALSCFGAALLGLVFIHHLRTARSPTVHHGHRPRGCCHRRRRLQRGQMDPSKRQRGAAGLDDGRRSPVDTGLEGGVPVADHAGVAEGGTEELQGGRPWVGACRGCRPSSGCTRPDRRSSAPGRGRASRPRTSRGPDGRRHRKRPCRIGDRRATTRRLSLGHPSHCA